MKTPNPITGDILLELPLTSDHARALANLVNRISLEQIRDLAKGQRDASAMGEALDILSNALCGAGYPPMEHSPRPWAPGHLIPPA